MRATTLARQGWVWTRSGPFCLPKEGCGSLVLRFFRAYQASRHLSARHPATAPLQFALT